MKPPELSRREFLAAGAPASVAMMEAVRPMGRSAGPTTTTPARLDGWHYTVRIWAPAAWRVILEADRPANARRMNDQGWRWEWVLDGPSPELIAHWDQIDKQFADLEERHPGVVDGVRIDRETGGTIGADGERGGEFRERYSTNPPEDWGRLDRRD